MNGNLVDANAMVHKISKLKGRIRFEKLSNIRAETIVMFSAVSNSRNCKVYERFWIIPKFKVEFDKVSLIRPIYWASCKQKKVFNSSYGAEIEVEVDPNDQK